MSTQPDKSLLESIKNSSCNRVPLVREVLADLDTPLSTYLKLANAPYTYLFESVYGGEKWGRYSIIGLPCSKIIRVSNTTVTMTDNGVVESEEVVDDPLQWIADFQQQAILAMRPSHISSRN